jgi:hypothetical protein
MSRHFEAFGEVEEPQACPTNPALQGQGKLAIER